MTSCHVFDPRRVTPQAHLGPAGGAEGNARGGTEQPSHPAPTLLDQPHHLAERLNGTGGQLRAGVRNALSTIDAPLIVEVAYHT